jgi:hypothetical protein
VSDPPLRDAHTLVIDEAEIKICHGSLVRFEGRLTSRGTRELEALVQNIVTSHDGAVSASVTVDVRRLQWADEAAMRVFVSWAMRIQHGPTAARLGIHFIIDPQSTWQRATFGTLGSLAPEVVEVRYEP